MDLRKKKTENLVKQNKTMRKGGKGRGGGVDKKTEFDS